MEDTKTNQRVKTRQRNKNIKQRQHKKVCLPREAKLDPNRHPPSEASLLIFTVSERYKAGIRYGKSDSAEQG